MRLVAGVLSLALFAPLARAEDTATPPAPVPAPPGTASPALPALPAVNDAARARVPFLLVRVMPETRQALVFDRSRNTHVLVEVGGQLDGYTVEDIDDESVSLRRDNQQVVLAAPPRGAGRARELPPVRLRSAAAPVSAAAALVPGGPRAPGGSPAPGDSPAPLDPYGDPPRPAEALAGQLPVPAPGDALPPEPGIRVVHAPGAATPPPSELASGPVIVPGQGGVRVAVAPDVGPIPGLAAASGPGPAPGIAPPSTATAGPGAIRVVSAAPGAVPSASSTSPGAQGLAPAASAAPGAVAGAPSAAPADPYSAPAASSPALAAPSTAPADPYSAPAAPSPVGAAPTTAAADPYSAPVGPSPVGAAPTTAAVAASPASGVSATAPVAASPARAATRVPTALDVGEPGRPSREIADPVTTPPRVPVAATAPAPAPADPKPAEIREVRAADAARVPDKQTADARALADILTADHPTRSPRAAVELRAPTHGAEVRLAVAPPTPGDAIAISRSDLDSALADFARLTAGVRGSFSATGVVIDRVGDGTIFQRAGLRTGDVVTSVDGVRLRTLDDAANLYARASTAKAITAQIVRAGKPVTLHVVIQ